MTRHFNITCRYSSNPSKFNQGGIGNCVLPQGLVVTDYIVDKFKKDVISAAVGYLPHENIVFATFRGTNGFKELIDEGLHLGGDHYCQTCPDTKDVMVSDFFFRAYLVLANRTKAAVARQAALHPTATVYVTGHSLGGSMGVQLAFELVHEGHLRVPPVLYTFGEPRTGNKAFAELVNHYVPESYRVVCESWGDDSDV